MAFTHCGYTVRRYPILNKVEVTNSLTIELADLPERLKSVAEHFSGSLVLGQQTLQPDIGFKTTLSKMEKARYEVTLKLECGPQGSDWIGFSVTLPKSSKETRIFLSVPGKTDLKAVADFETDRDLWIWTLPDFIAKDDLAKVTTATGHLMVKVDICFVEALVKTPATDPEVKVKNSGPLAGLADRDDFCSKFSDLGLVSRDNDVVPCFAVVLAAKSSVLEALLAEAAKSKDDQLILSLDDHSTEAVTAFWKSLLEGSLILTVDEDETGVALELIAMADKYKIESLTDQAVERLIEIAKVHTILEIAVKAWAFDVERLKAFALEFIGFNRGRPELTFDRIFEGLGSTSAFKPVMLMLNE